MDPDTETTVPTFSATDRRALASVAVQFFVNGAAFASFVPRLPEIRTRLGLSLDTLGLMLTAALTLGLAGGFIAPSLIARFGTRRTLIALASVLVAGLPILGVATVPVVFIIGFAAMLIADSVVDIAMNLQGSWLSERRHTPVMNRLHGLWSLGTVVGGLTAAQAASAGVSLTTHFVVVAVVLGLAVAFVGRGLLAVDEGVDENEQAPVDGVVPKRTRANWIILFVLAVSGAFSITVELVSSEWAAFRLSEDFNALPGFAGLGYVAFTTGMTIGRLGGDSVLVRVGMDRLIQMAIIVAGVGLAVAGLAPNRWIVLVAYVVAGIGISVFFPKLYDDAAKFRGKRGAGIAWLRVGSGITALLIPTVVGVLGASRLSVGTATVIVTMPCIVGFLLLTLRSARLNSAPSPVTS